MKILNDLDLQQLMSKNSTELSNAYKKSPIHLVELQLLLALGTNYQSFYMDSYIKHLLNEVRKNGI